VVQVIEHLEDTVFRNEKAVDIKQRMAHFRALRDLCLFLLFTLTGVRLSEAWGVRIDEIDFDRRSLRIAAKGNRAERKKHRDILLPDALWRRLIAYLRVRSVPADGRLWISCSGRPLSIQGVNKAIVRRVREAGIDKQISPHRLRATCASLYVKKGMDPFSLKTLLGHESISTTVEHYTRLSNEELREVWKRTNPLADIDEG
jgi:site-specific recombinase XerD